MELVNRKKSLARRETRTQSPRPRQRTRRTRAEGRELLISAATELLKSKSPDDITIRELGRVAGVHHRFVAEWFGGKTELFREVHDRNAQLNSQLISETRFLSGQDQTTLEAAKKEIRLVFWLLQNGSTFSSFDDAFPNIGFTAELLRKIFKLQPEQANMSANIVGALLFAETLLEQHLKPSYNFSDLLEHHFAGAIRHDQP